jgi:hypothetical protein
MEKLSVHVEAEQEAGRYRWIESEKAGSDLGEAAIREWVRQHWWGYLRACWLEHLQGTRYWVELDRGDFGLLQRDFRDDALLLDRVLDRFKAGRQNLDIVLWAVEWGIPLDRLVPILEAIDINGRCLAHRLDHPDAPAVKLDPAWLAWNGGPIRRLAWGIVEQGAFDGLSVLGDAFEEAGCDDDAILEHCRSAGPHTRRSWLVDLILWAS